MYTPALFKQLPYSTDITFQASFCKASSPWIETSKNKFKQNPCTVTISLVETTVHSRVSFNKNSRVKTKWQFACQSRLCGQEPLKVEIYNKRYIGGPSLSFLQL